MDLIERIGSYVGMVSFLGLAILALLYFSQARDVRRLRDWAGRAPERAVELERTPTEPARVVPPALPASQHSLPATPFSETAVRKRRPVRERIRNVHIPQARYIALSVAGVLVLGGAAYGAVELVGGQNDSESTKSAQGKSGQRKNSGDSSQRQVNVDPARVTVAILNGTTVQGLAAKVGEEVGAAGFTLGTIGNAARIDQSRSQVLYRKGQSASARAVANRLSIQSITPVDSVNAEIAGSFDAIVLVGSDRSQ